MSRMFYDADGKLLPLSPQAAENAERAELVQKVLCSGRELGAWASGPMSELRAMTQEWQARVNDLDRKRLAPASRPPAPPPKVARLAPAPAPSPKPKESDMINQTVAALSRQVAALTAKVDADDIDERKGILAELAKLVDAVTAEQMAAFGAMDTKSLRAVLAVVKQGESSQKRDARSDARAFALTDSLHGLRPMSAYAPRLERNRFVLPTMTPDEARAYIAAKGGR